MPSMRKTSSFSMAWIISSIYYVGADTITSGCDPLTPDDIAEVIVFAATRRENVVVAESLLYPNHQVSGPLVLILAHAS